MLKNARISVFEPKFKMLGSELQILTLTYYILMFADEDEEIHRIGLHTTDEGWLKCPSCMIKGYVNDPCSYIHPMKVRIVTDDKTVTINKDGITTTEEMTEDLRKAKGHGVRIVIKYNCEDRHIGEIIFQFHKGNTFLTHKFLEEIDSDDDERYCETIWRD
jgi:hypothetical protein